MQQLSGETQHISRASQSDKAVKPTAQAEMPGTQSLCKLQDERCERGVCARPVSEPRDGESTRSGFPGGEGLAGRERVRRSPPWDWMAPV